MKSTSDQVPRVAIVLLSYNSLPLIKRFLPLIVGTTAHLPRVEIVVVDNASTDSTDGWIRQNHPNIRIITITDNHGFTGGYTESLPQIQAENYVLISSDIEVTKGWLEAGLEVLESADDIAAVQPKVKSYDRRDEFEYAGAAGGYIDYLGYPFCRGRLVNSMEKDEGQFEDVREIFWASGACLFVKAELFHKAGGLDNDFFAHMEEIDLAWRFKNMGYKIMYQPKAEIYHMGGYVIQYGSAAKIFRNHRNNLIMLLKNLPSNEVWWKIPFRFLLDYATFFKMLLDGNPKSSMAVVKAHQDFVFNLSTWKRKRKEVQKLFVKDRNTFGICPKSLVVEFFLKGKRKFKELNWDPTRS